MTNDELARSAQHFQEPERSAVLRVLGELAEARRQNLDWQELQYGYNDRENAASAEIGRLQAARDRYHAALTTLREALIHHMQRMQWRQGGGQTIGAGVYHVVLSVDDYETLRAALEGEHD